KAEFDAIISNIASLKPEELVDSHTCIWSLSHADKFSVNSIRKHINELSFPSLSLSAWRYIDSIMCTVCNVSVESSAHTFFSCDTASAVWHLVRVWSGSMFPSFSSCGEWDLWFQSWHASKEKKDDRAYAIFAASCLFVLFENNL
ncbi:RNA-directed DNA polymerase, eukaryota, reverse transcriptase zinc-binding domain protein, partial [Tanacetum coccineum]